MVADMEHRPADLPDFERPPLVEVVLSVQFAELTGYRTIHAGLLWSELGKAYPRVAEKPPQEPIFEVFGSQAGPSNVQFRQMPGPVVPRLWFMNGEETEVVQIQANRFTRNWRKVGEGERYPRYERLRERFFADLLEVDAFFRDWGIGSIQPNQCEITYVNYVALDGCDLRRSPERALTLFPARGVRRDGDGPGLPEQEDCNLLTRYVLRDARGEPCGRFVVTVQPWLGEPALRLDLSVRGAPSTPDFEAAADFIDAGRQTIVHGFTAITTNEMHKLWGRRQWEFTG